MPPFYLLLPNIRSSHNVGAMFRTADAFGVTKLFLVGYTPTPPRQDIHKVALGAEEWVPWEKRGKLLPLVKRLKQEGCFIAALEKTETSTTLPMGRGGRPLALIVGNEVKGVQKNVLELCDAVWHIPMQGKKESLNVSVAAGIALYALQPEPASNF